MVSGLFFRQYGVLVCTCERLISAGTLARRALMICKIYLKGLGQP